MVQLEFTSAFKAVGSVAQDEARGDHDGPGKLKGSPHDEDQGARTARVEESGKHAGHKTVAERQRSNENHGGDDLEAQQVGELDEGENVRQREGSIFKQRDQQRYEQEEYGDPHEDTAVLREEANDCPDQDKHSGKAEKDRNRDLTRFLPQQYRK